MERQKMYLFLRSALSFSRHSRFLFKNRSHSSISGGFQAPVVPLQPGITSLFRVAFSKTLVRVRHWSRNHSCVSVRGFHTSQPRHAAPLAVLLVKLAGPLSKVIKLVAVVGGRSFRKWWRNLSADKRLHLTKRFSPRKEKIAIVIGGFGGICVAYYFFHLEETPFTHRTRFMPISHKQMQELTDAEHRNMLELFAKHILPVNHPDHLRVYRVAKQLVVANYGKEMENLTWQVSVVECEEMNALALPNGQIFIFTGMLKVLPNDDSLATILGHEMSHAVLQHAAEQVSLCGFINMFIVIVLALLWALLPTDLTALFAHWLQNQILQILLHLPYSRKLEEEADEVGMNMAAKACFDVRESPRFWRRVAVTQSQTDQPELLKWLSTHPTHSDRADNLEALLPQALEVRRSCNCPALPGEVSFLSQEDQQWVKRLQLQARKTFMTDRTKISTPSDHSAK